MPLQVPVYAPLRSNATGPFQPASHRRRRWFERNGEREQYWLPRSRWKMLPRGGARKAMAILSARIAGSRFMRLLTAQPSTTAGTRLLSAGVSLSEIAAHMGWSIRTASVVIAHYARVSPGESDGILIKLAVAKGNAV